MRRIKNSDLLREVILMLITITGRRASETIACAFMEAIIKTLIEKYEFLKYVTVKNITLHEGIRADAILIKPNINSVESREIGEAIESIIRVLCMDLEEDTGLFFIKELKTRLHETYLVQLKKCGVDLELLKLEQKHLHEQLERRKSLVHHEDETVDSELKVEMPNYSWKSVASFKYRNNICFLYDKNGKLLDKLNVNKLIEYYVRTLTDFGKLVVKQNKIQVTEKQYKLLQLLYERDLDEKTALFLLDATRAEFNHLLQQLLRYEFLQYISYDEIKLTEKGIEVLEEKKRQPEGAAAS